MSGFEAQKFGFSNFCDNKYPERVSFPLDSFPFVSIRNHGSLCSHSSVISAISEWREETSLQNWESRNPSFNAEKKLECVDATLKSVYDAESLPPDWNRNNIIKVDLSMGSIKVHFHDSSCILGTVSVSVSESRVYICDEQFDMLCSTGGLTISCPWWSLMFHDFLWGPLLPDISPILNIRLKKENIGLEKYHLCISFGIQHASCILPPDFLALLIGYFSLPEWKCCATEQPFCGSSKYVNSEDKVAIEYKFEILDSVLLIPASFDDLQFLKLDIQQLHCSFMQSSGKYAAMEDIPTACLVMTDKIAEINSCLNIIGNDLSLSLLLRDDVLQSSLDQLSGWRHFTLIAPFSANVWVRIPRQSENSVVGSSYPTCIMASATNCQLNAEGACVIFGYEALVNVINEFSLIDQKSEAFTGDVVQFLQLMKDRVANPQPEASFITSIEIRFCARWMTIRLQQTVKDSMTSEVVADAEMQFACSASLMNDKPIFLDISFSSLTLFSLLNSVILAECSTNCSSSSSLRVTFSLSEQGENRFHVCLPSLDIWLHRYDWSQVYDVFISYSGELSTNSAARHSSNISTINRKDLVQDFIVNIPQDSLQSPNVLISSRPVSFQQNSSFHVLQLENIGIKVHFPAQVTGDECRVFSNVNLNDSGIKVSSDQVGFVTFSVQSKPSELVVDGKTMRMKINLEKARGTMELYSDTDEVTLPLFQLSEILFEGKITNYQMAHICIKCDTLDVWLSSHFVHLQYFMKFEVPMSGPSSTSFDSFGLDVRFIKLTLLFADGKWSRSGSLLEVVMRNIVFLSNTVEGEMEGSVEGDLEVNYNNIDKVLWESFIEPWEMQLTLATRHAKSALLNSVVTTNIQLKSRSQLNLNVTESLIEVISRTTSMIEDTWNAMRMTIPSEGHGFPSCQINRNRPTGGDAPYIIQNLTSLPLVFCVCKENLSSGDWDVYSLPSQDGNLLQPGSSAPVFVDENPEEFVCSGPSRSSDKLNEKHLLEAGHRYILIQFEGTSMPSGPISMDLVGLRYFEVDFSKSTNKAEADHVRDAVRSSNKGEGDWSCGNSGFVVPVVIDVSVERYVKLIRLFSTVVLLNATSVPLEVRFDIPFGVAPKILDPIKPGHEFPLPLHLAESGFIRWRPLGDMYLWSEAYSISKILSHEYKISFLRSVVCYPSYPSSDPFRCCVLVNSDSLHSVRKLKKGHRLSVQHNKIEMTESSDHSFHNPDTSGQRFIYWLSLSTPLVFKNYLPEAVSLILDNGSVTRNAILSEVETSFFHVDSSHDLTITMKIRGFKSSSLKFQRAETFCSMAKFDGTRLCLVETCSFYPESLDGPLRVNIEKIMDGFSGARELCISVPFLLCNCTGLPLVILSYLDDMSHGVTIPSCYDLDADFSLGRKDGLALFSCDQDLHAAADTDKLMMASFQGHIRTKSNEYKSLDKPLNSVPLPSLRQSSQNCDPNALKVSVSTLCDEVAVGGQSNLKSTAFLDRDNRKTAACMYSPDASSSSGELMVRISRYCTRGIVANCSWSTPFPLVPPTGSISILVPQPALGTADVLSVSAGAAPFSGRTRIITFQPRYVISNACDKAFYYKQKGTDFAFLLDAGDHCNIQWSDTTRELLVSVRFGEPGWQWSGCFLPEHLGDTQVKIHNYLSGAVTMMRVEVQTADASVKDVKDVGSSQNSGTHIVLVSIDDTGFMPYRIDNFSKERLRIYQQKCETFETLVNSYTSCPYAWDEPCYSHRLMVEVPGERVIGSYALDDVKDLSPIYLPATSEKPSRTLFVSVHSEGAIKVLSIIDATYHNLSEIRSPDFPHLNYKRNHAQKHEIVDHCTERIAIEIPFIGISVMNSSPKELLFVCAKGVAVDMMQSLDQQKFALQFSSLQIDNQLHNTPYPVILSFDFDNIGHPVNQNKMIGDPNKITNGIASDKSSEPVLFLAVAKWRNKDVTVVSFEYISLRVADFHLELEQEIVLSLVDFLRVVSSRLESRVLHHMGSTLHPFFPDVKAVSNTTAVNQANKLVNVKGKFNFSDDRTAHDQKSDLLHVQVIPIGAPWQQIYLLARQQKKIYVELLDLAPVTLSLSFSSSPWMLRNGVLTSGESLIHRGLVALADIEGAKVHLKQLSLSHQLASWESIQEILVRHYTRQFIHEIYKLFGSAGVLGNPMGFARILGLGLKDFLSVPVQSVFESPAGLITGMAQGTTSLLSNTVYAISDAATQFSKVVHKSIVAFTFDDQIVTKMERQQTGMTTSNNKGLINGFFEGLTGLLQSPIKGAEKHGIPGVLSGVALGVTGLVARPAASILEVTGKTAQSIRNRSRVHHTGSRRLRVRLPRPLSKESALKPYSWEEAVGTSVLVEADDGMKLIDEILVMCKRLKQGGKYVIITERLVLVVSCSSLVDVGKPFFRGIPAEPEWVIEKDIGLDSIIHADNNGEVVHVVGSSSDPLLRQNRNQHVRVGVGNRRKLWNQSSTQTPILLPLFHVNLEFLCSNDAENFLRVLLSTIEKGKDQGWGCVHLLHRSNLK